MAVQSGHAAIRFCIEHPELTSNWYYSSEYLAYLSVSNEYELKRQIDKLQSKEITISIFREPDLNNEITAIAVEPSKRAQRLCSSLPLAMKEYNKQTKVLSDVGG